MLISTDETTDSSQNAEQLQPKQKRSRKQQFDKVRSVEMEVFGLTWLRCNFKGCTRIFQDLIKLKNHEDNFHTQEFPVVDLDGDGENSSLSPAARPNLRLPGNRNEIIQIKNLKIVLQRIDSLIKPVEVEIASVPFSSVGPIEQPSTSDWVPHAPPPLINASTSTESTRPSQSKEEIEVEIFLCEENGCKQVFSKISRLHEHIANFHAAPGQPSTAIRQFQCQQCPLKFKSFSYLGRHIKRVHVKVVCFKCKHCGKEFNDVYNGKRHEDTHTMRFECEVCHEEFQNSNDLHDHEKTHGDLIYKYKCRFCGKTFKRAKHLRFHEETHNDERKFKCKYCDKAYKHAVGLRKHKQAAHDFLHYCKKCNEEFETSGQLRKHEKIHEGYKYEFCGKVFKFQSIAVNPSPSAILINSEIYRLRPKKSQRSSDLKCEFCDKTFRLHANRITHERKVHFDLYLSKYGGQYACQGCGVRFQYQSLLDDHQLNCYQSSVSRCKMDSGIHRNKTEVEDPLGFSPMDIDLMDSQNIEEANNIEFRDVEQIPSDLDLLPTTEIKVEKYYY